MKYLFFAFCLVLTLLIGAPSFGGDFWLMPSVGIRQEYNDNLFFDTSNKMDDYVTTLIGALELQQKTERLDLNVRGEVDPRFYADNAKLDAVDQSYRAKGSYRLTPRLSASGSATYIKDSRADRDIEVTGLVLTPSTRYRQQYGAKAEYMVSEKNAVSLDAGYWKDHYGASTLTDMEAQTANLTMMHDLSSVLEATKGRVTFGYSGYQFSDQANTEVRDYSGMVGATHSLSEVWSLSIDGGVRYTTGRFDQTVLVPVTPSLFLVTTERQKSTGWGGVGQAVFSYRGEKTTVDLSAGHILQPASGDATTTNRTFLMVTASRRLTYELSATIAAEYFLNKSSGQEYGSEKVDEETMRVSPGMRYVFNPDLAVEASYGFTRVKYKTTNETARRNLVLARLLYQHKIFE